jgi:hypothetical protein
LALLEERSYCFMEFKSREDDRYQHLPRYQQDHALEVESMLLELADLRIELTSEVERQQNLRQSEKMLRDKKLEESEMALHDLKRPLACELRYLFFHVSPLWSTALFSINEFPTVLQHCTFLK